MSNSILAQVSKEYEIFLFFNSEKKEMVIDTLNSDTDTIFRYFISKPEIKKPSYVIKINQDGMLKKYLKGTTSSNCCKLTLKHNSKKNKKKKILKVNSKKNIIKYEDFMDVSFVNFIDIINKAKKIYIIDSGQETRDDLYYTAYEVSF